MIGMITGALSNIILDAVFIIPLNMGIKGAALATLLAQVLVVIYELRYYISRSSFLRLHSKNLLLNTSIVRNIFSIGIASFAHMMAGSLSAALVNRVLVSTGGDIAVSAFGVMNRILMFAIMPGIVIGQGLQPILGFNYGAKRYDRALKSIKIAMTAASICSIIVFVLIYFIPEPFIMIFTPDSELIEQSAYAAKRMCLGIYLIGFMMVGSVSFQSIGKAVESFITSVSRPALFMIPAIFILPLFWQIDGVWLSFPVSDWLASLLTLALFIPQIRELRKLRENENTRFR
jgi:Na+-driven multidrug efflux pump